MGGNVIRVNGVPMPVALGVYTSVNITQVGEVKSGWGGVYTFCQLPRISH